MHAFQIHFYRLSILFYRIDITLSKIRLFCEILDRCRDMGVSGWGWLKDSSSQLKVPAEVRRSLLTGVFAQLSNILNHVFADYSWLSSPVPQLVLTKLCLNCAPSNFMPQLCPRVFNIVPQLCLDCAPTVPS